jgi:hypothetical protein
MTEEEALEDVEFSNWKHYFDLILEGIASTGATGSDCIDKANAMADLAVQAMEVKRASLIK